MTIKSDGGQISQISNLDVVLVPYSPYNLIPLQILVTLNENLRFYGRKNYHDEKQYISEYCLPIKHPNLFHTFKIIISSNGLFQFRIKTGYNSFMRHASRLQPSFKHFCGISHIIPSDGDDIFDYCRHVHP